MCLLLDSHQLLRIHHNMTVVGCVEQLVVGRMGRCKILLLLLLPLNNHHLLNNLPHLSNRLEIPSDPGKLLSYHRLLLRLGRSSLVGNLLLLLGSHLLRNHLLGIHLLGDHNLLDSHLRSQT